LAASGRSQPNRTTTPAAATSTAAVNKTAGSSGVCSAPAIPRAATTAAAALSNPSTTTAVKRQDFAVGTPASARGHFNDRIPLMAALHKRSIDGASKEHRQIASGGADIPVCHVRRISRGRQECLPHRGEKCRLSTIYYPLSLTYRAAAASSVARSVFSQVNSGSLRPKCPPEAVLR